MAAVGIGEELKASAAGIALKIMLHRLGGPLRVEEVVYRTGAFQQRKYAFVDDSEKAAGEFQIFTRFLEALALEKLIAYGTRGHWTSVTPPRSNGIRIEGAGVTVPERYSGRWSVISLQTVEQ
jgi:hypothetical protein